MKQHWVRLIRQGKWQLSAATKLVEALKQGGPAKIIVAELQQLEAKQENLEATLKHSKAPAPFLHPNMAKLYQQKLTDLYTTLNSDDTKQEAISIVRSLIDHVVLVPKDGKLLARIEGDLASLLEFMSLNEESLILQEDKALQLELVAGARTKRKLTQRLKA